MRTFTLSPKHMFYVTVSVITSVTIGQSCVAQPAAIVVPETVVQTPTANDVRPETAKKPRPVYPWLKTDNQPQGVIKKDTIESRFPPPAGARRKTVTHESFGAWLRGLPLYEAGTPVYLHSGRLKPKQSVHAGVINIDVGRANLQQCADAIIRLRAEYLYAQKPRPEISFSYTSGDAISFSRWIRGERPRVIERTVKGKKRWRVEWTKGHQKGDYHQNLRAYLNNVFNYAGTASLARTLTKRAPQDIQIGDLYLQGGFPGHAVLVVDAAEHPRLGTLVLLSQSYMPAQDIHVLKNLHDPSLSPWFRVPHGGKMRTPEWTFRATDLYHF